MPPPPFNIKRYAHQLHMYICDLLAVRSLPFLMVLIGRFEEDYMSWKCSSFFSLSPKWLSLLMLLLLFNLAQWSLMSNGWLSWFFILNWVPFSMWRQLSSWSFAIRYITYNLLRDNLFSRKFIFSKCFFFFVFLLLVSISVVFPFDWLIAMRVFRGCDKVWILKFSFHILV